MFAKIMSVLAFANAFLRPTVVGSTTDRGRLAFGSVFRLGDTGRIKLGSVFRLVDAPVVDTGRVKVGSAYRLPTAAA